MKKVSILSKFMFITAMSLPVCGQMSGADLWSYAGKATTACISGCKRAYGAAKKYSEYVKPVATGIAVGVSSEIGRSVFLCITRRNAEFKRDNFVVAALVGGVAGGVLKYFSRGMEKRLRTEIETNRDGIEENGTAIANNGTAMESLRNQISTLDVDLQNVIRDGNDVLARKIAGQIRDLKKELLRDLKKELSKKLNENNVMLKRLTMNTRN